MSIDTDWLIDRRRLKRGLTFWRIAAVIAAVAALVAVISRYTAITGGAHVARLAIDGIIADDADRDGALADLAEDDTVRALIVRIDSPGGTVVGGEALYRLLRRVAEHKPVVAVMGELATSAAYMAAIGTDHIIAHDGTLTGSIGVILQTADVVGLLDKLGIRPETIKSGPLKAQPNPFEPFSPEAREATRAVIDDVFAMFLGLVQERRSLTHEQVAEFADGRVVTGRQAKAVGLVDEIGAEPEALSWLVHERGIAEGTPVRDLEWRGTERGLRDLIGGYFGKALSLERLRLDGLVSVWHPAL